MIYTSPITRYAIRVDGSESPVTETVVWAYAPDHHLSVRLPEEVHAKFAADMIRAADEMNAVLRADHAADMKAWNDMPKSERPPKPVQREAEQPENGWVILDGSWMVEGDPSEGMDIYNMPPRRGWRFVDEEDFIEASKVWNAKFEAKLEEDSLTEMKARLEMWDTKADVYRKVGLTEDDIATVLGERPVA